MNTRTVIRAAILTIPLTFANTSLANYSEDEGLRFYSYYHFVYNVLDNIASQVPQLREEATSEKNKFVDYFKPYEMIIDRAMRHHFPDEWPSMKSEFLSTSASEVRRDFFNRDISSQQYRRLMSRVILSYRDGSFTPTSAAVMAKLGIGTPPISHPPMTTPSHHEDSILVTNIPEYLRSHGLSPQHEIIRVGKEFTLVMPSPARRRVVRAGVTDTVWYESHLPIGDVDKEHISMRAEIIPLEQSRRSLLIANLEQQMREPFASSGISMSQFSVTNSNVGMIAEGVGIGRLAGRRVTLHAKWIIGNNVMASLLLLEPPERYLSPRGTVFLNTISKSAELLDQ